MSNALMRLTVEHIDGTVDSYDVRPVTVVAFERKFGMGVSAALNDLHMEHIYWLGWDCEHKSGKVVKPFDGWLEDVASVEVADDDSVPLESAPSPAS